MHRWCYFIVRAQGLGPRASLAGPGQALGQGLGQALGQGQGLGQALGPGEGGRA